MNEAARDAHLLVVDDDDRIRSLLKDYLKNHGYRVSVAPDAGHARTLMASLDFDLLILDVMMPGEDGFTLARSVRERSAVPILLLTARGDPDDRITGLSLGADDYLAKPFEPEELLLRIDAILRRAQPAARPVMVRFGPCHYTLDAHQVERNGKPVRLTEGEAALLTVLAAHPGEAMEREALAARAGSGGGRSVDVQVARLRRKIEDDPRNPSWLQTVRGSGYKLVAEVEDGE